MGIAIIMIIIIIILAFLSFQLLRTKPSKFLSFPHIHTQCLGQFHRLHVQPDSTVPNLVQSPPSPPVLLQSHPPRALCSLRPQPYNLFPTWPPGGALRTKSAHLPSLLGTLRPHHGLILHGLHPLSLLTPFQPRRSSCLFWTRLLWPQDLRTCPSLCRGASFGLFLQYHFLWKIFPGDRGD